ncbi:FAD-dependent oxidoreductase [Corynebacterium sp. A21]|uniref:FAD-dependent oxidoreductase n=1 Tax=Corynebacterium sp. A21 TaxID=3457318 RepID=UPI003FD490AB
MSEKTTCVVVGGGPAGMFLGLILARAGVEVTVLEKHGDFLRDFRGDTVHPTTMQLLAELGLWEEFEQLPQSKVTKMSFKDDSGKPVTLIDFTRIRARHRYIAMVPQWDLLDMLAAAGRREPTFTLRMNTEATDVIRSATGVVTGVRYSSAEGAGSISADLVIACDGRHSTLRQAVGLVPQEYPVNIDAWWCRVPAAENIDPFLLPRFGPGRGVIAIPREGYFQVAYLSEKGTDARLRARGIEAFRKDLAELLPEVADQLAELESMDQVKFLDVHFNRLRTWHVPGLLCLGDAAHAMSPAGGLGINVAVQDAVAAARLLAKPLLAGEVTERHLKAVRKRRLPAVIAAQGLQRVIHRNLINPMILGKMLGPPKPILVLARRLPFLTVVPAYLVGIGLRPEHVPRFARR